VQNTSFALSRRIHAIPEQRSFSMPLDGYGTSEYPGRDGGVHGELTLNDVVEIRVQAAGW
jgi:hypothetical protein